MFMLVLSIGYVSAQGKADIKFDKTSHNFGTFSENDPVVSCVFTFTNVGDAPLVIHQSRSFLWMYSSRIYPGTRIAGQNRNR